MFEFKQDEIIDKLMDVPKVSADEVFKELKEENKKSMLQFSGYVLADRWNNSKAVKYGMVQGKTAADFMLEE